MKCPNCPVVGYCLGEDHFPFFCDWAMDGNPVHMEHIRLRSAIPYEPPVPAPAAPLSPAPAAALAGGIPLAGDLLAAATARLGVDRLAKYVAEQLGADCGCEERRIKINALDARLRRWLGLGG